MIPPTYNPKKKFGQLPIAKAKRTRDRGEKDRACSNPYTRVYGFELHGLFLFGRSSGLCKLHDFRLEPPTHS